MTGLATGLLTAGARAVVAPVLPVPDDVSARLSLRWHRHLREGRDPAAALAALLAGTPAREPLARLAASTMICLGHSQ